MYSSIITHTVKQTSSSENLQNMGEINEVALVDSHENNRNKDVEQLTSLSFNTTVPVSVKVRELSVKARQNAGILNKIFSPFKSQSSGDNLDLERNDIKTILHPSSLNIAAGTVTAIMGGSGSGKTTMLNSLAQRQASGSNLISTSSITYNNSDNINSVRHAYVIQQDILLPQLTCYETLMYAAELRLPKVTSKESRNKLVEEIILELELKECRDTLVGDRVNKGLSGGEKRRLSIGIQMMSNPSILFLDEPTTGLDSFNAFKLCSALKRLANRGKTFVLSIHQPRSDIFRIFDQIIILSKGKVCYADKGSEAVPYFAELGYQVPPFVNPADYLIDITSVDNRTPQAEQDSKIRVERFTSLWEEKMKHLDDPPKELNEKSIRQRNPIYETNKEDVFEHIGRAPLLREIAILTRRNFKLQSRDPVGYFSLLMESLVLGLVTGWIFFKPACGLAGIRTLEGALYTCSNLQAYLYLLYETYRLCTLDIKIFDRERSENCISIIGFVISRRITKLLTEDVMIPFFYSICTYFMIGFRTDSASYFFYFFLGNLIFHQLSMSFAMVAVALSRDVAIATVICNLNFTYQTMANGFFVNVVQLPVYVRWTKYASYQWYAYGLVTSNQFTDYKGCCFDQYAGDPNVDSICKQYDGNYILKGLGFWRNWRGVPIGATIGFIVVFYATACIILKLKPVDVVMGKEVKINDYTDLQSENKLEENEESKPHTETTIERFVHLAEDKPLDITIRSIFLSVSLSSPANILPAFLKSQNTIRHKDILLDIDALFQAGKLNAIMGPSGSGKSSLLNLISGRLSSSFFTKYSSSGSIFFNEHKVDPTTVQKICSYVSQDDDSLLPTLSVRETLMFAAKLRLSHLKISHREMEEMVQGIILKMGLRDCQNTLIGSEFVKGISGGEKRRVSIAIQLINNPKVLLLDEPTSGLDSFTASSILSVLEQLTKEGKTVIMTIHQPRYDLFEKFGSVLLLAKGGNVAFNGPPLKLVEYFSDLGYPVPQFTNAADHVLDVVSYSTQNELVELEDRKRVDMVLNNWKNNAKLNYLTYTLENTRLDENSKLVTVSQLVSEFGSFSKKRCNFTVGTITLLQRQTICLFRDMNNIVARCSQVIGMGVILALFFARLKHNYLSIQDRLGLIQQISSLYFVGVLNNVAIYPTERDFFYEEYFDEVVLLPSFFIAYILVELPFEIITSIVYAVFMVFVIGLQYDVKLFFVIAYAAFAIVNAGESLGITFNTVVNHSGFAVNVISVFASIGTAMAGFVAMTLDDFLKAMDYLSPAHYGVTLFANYVFTSDLIIKCSGKDGDCSNSAGPITGLEILEQYGVTRRKTLFLILLGVMTICHRVIAYFLIKIRLTRFTLKLGKFGK